MLEKKDKIEIVDEVWTLDRIKSFLDLIPPQGLNADFHALFTAYKNMRLADFEKFLDFFSQSKRNFNATNNDGDTLENIIKEHRRSNDYLLCLKRYL